LAEGRLIAKAKYLMNRGTRFSDSVDDLRWTGTRPNFAEHYKRMKSAALFDRVKATELFS
jgi:hypothetical protein